MGKKAKQDKKGKKAEKKDSKKVLKAEKKALKAAKKAAKAAEKPKAKKSGVKKRGGKKIKPRKQPETLRIRDAIPALVVNDLAASLAFYRDGLGFVVVEEMKGESGVNGVRIRAGQTMLLLSQDDFAKGRDRKKGEGLRFYCVTKQPVDAVADRVRGTGITISEEPADQPWGARDFSLIDPDGFKFSIANWDPGD